MRNANFGGIFYGNEDPIGSLVSNSSFGIYSYADDFRDFELVQPMVMGRQEQVETGDAYILTTVDGDKVEKFDIEIKFPCVLNSQYDYTCNENSIRFCYEFKRR